MNDLYWNCHHHHLPATFCPPTKRTRTRMSPRSSSSSRSTSIRRVSISTMIILLGIIITVLFADQLVVVQAKSRHSYHHTTTIISWKNRMGSFQKVLSSEKENNIIQYNTNTILQLSGGGEGGGGNINSSDDDSYSSVTPGGSETMTMTMTTLSPLPLLVRDLAPWMRIRGGSDDDEEEEEEEDDDEEEEEESGINNALDVSTVMEQALEVSTRIVTIVGKFTWKVTKSTIQAMQRAIQAGLHGPNEDDDDDEVTAEEDEEEVTIVEKIVRTMKRMVQAALTPPEEEDSDDNDIIVKDSMSKSVQSKSPKTKTIISEDSSDEEDEEGSDSIRSSDLGTFLSKAYGVTDERDMTVTGPSMLGGTLTEALDVARSQARLLLVFLPATRPTTKNINTADQIAIESMLSRSVQQAANKQARKSGGSTTGSFLIWGAKFGSSEATLAMKRLKAKASVAVAVKNKKGGKNQKPPMLLVVYPDQKLDSSGRPKLVPRVLAQHHCSPPPPSTLMAAWLNALRKRHAKQYSVMQKQLKEVEWYKERKEGYTDSVQADLQRKEEEQIAEAKRLASEKKEQEKKEAILKRREELKASLPDESKTSGRNAKTIALRFADGQSGQRKFSPDTPMSTIFNWIDAMYEIDRETIILTTLRGDKTFTWEEDDNGTKKDDESLEMAGLGRQTGFRVTIKKEEEGGSSTTEDASSSESNNAD